MDKLEAKLNSLLMKLKHNQENIPLNVLKTKYKKSYEALIEEISLCAKDYIASIYVSGIRCKPKYLDEFVYIINNILRDENLSKQLSHALYIRKDIDEIKKIAIELRMNLYGKLAIFYETHSF